jgi:type VI secretion system protein ImpB
MSQKFIARNRAPRVQIEYDVELYGAEKKVQLPFVMGVMADLSGNAGKAPPPVADRKFLEISVDNFDDRLKAIEPRVTMQVRNTLTGDGNLSLEMTFDGLEDFSPGAIARKIPALKQLLDARAQLTNLLTYMDGKSGAEDLIAKTLNDPALLQSLSKSSNPKSGE